MSLSSAKSLTISLTPLSPTIAKSRGQQLSTFPRNSTAPSSGVSPQHVRNRKSPASLQDSEQVGSKQIYVFGPVNNSSELELLERNLHLLLIGHTSSVLLYLSVFP